MNINVAALARARVAMPLTEEACASWFGVGLATIERIEAGEVEPGEELAQRIDRFVAAGVGLSPSPAALPGVPFAHSGEPLGAGAVLQLGSGAGCGEAR